MENPTYPPSNYNRRSQPILSVVTLTSDRPEAMKLCHRWMRRSTWYGQPLQWIIVDDGKDMITPTDTFLDIAKDFGSAVRYIRRDSGRSPVDSFRKNLVAGLRAVTGRVVVFVEDDDWQSDLWLGKCVHYLSGIPAGENWDLYGETGAKYYHVGSRRHMTFLPSDHASLGQTAMRAELIPWFINYIKTHANTFMLDTALWGKSPVPKDRRLLEQKSKHVISIKGMPGKINLGIGRSMKSQGKLDTDLRVLHKWIGDDADAYREFGE